MTGRSKASRPKTGNKTGHGKGRQQGQGKPPRRRNEGGKNSRLFFALRVPDAVAVRLVEAQGLLRGNWRRVDQAQLHITLAYLPRVPAAREDEIKRLGAEAANVCPPLGLNLRGTGYFPNEGSPRVWFVKAEAEEGAQAESLSALAEDLRVGVADLGLAGDDKPFKAHVTLARKKGPAPRVQPLLFDDLAWTARRLYLIRSTLRKTGPIYETVSRFELRGAPANLPPADLLTEANPTEADPNQSAHIPNATQEQP